MLMLALGFSLNLLTLLAMVLAIGLVVDDAIVVVENVHRHIEEGLTPRPGVAGRCARDRRAGGRDDHHPGGGLRADRLPYRPDRLALSRVRLHPRRCGDHLGRGGADSVADDVLVDPQGARLARAFRRSDRPDLHARHRLVRPAARPLARLPAGHGPVRGRGPGHYRLPVPAYQVGAGAGGGSGDRLFPDQGAAIRQSRLCRRLRKTARRGIRLVPGDRHALRRQRHAGRAEQRHRRHDPQALGRARAHGHGAQPAGPGQAQRDHRRAGVRLLAAAAPGLDRRPAGADGDQLARPATRPCSG